MKIYLPNVLNNINISTLEEACVKKNKIKNFIFSEEGIAQIFNTCIKKIIIKDVPISDISINDRFNGVVDKSKLVVGEEIYQIPAQHGYTSCSYNSYYLRPKALISLTVHNINNKLHDVYFETISDTLDNCIIEDINTFLTLLKIY